MSDSNVIIANLQINMTQNLIHLHFLLKAVNVKKIQNYLFSSLQGNLLKVCRLLRLENVEYGNLSQISIDCLTILLNRK